MKKAPMAVALALVFGLLAAALSQAPAIAQDYASNTTTSTGNQTTTAGTTGTNATGGATDNQTTTAAGSTFSASGRIAAIIYDTMNDTEAAADTGGNMTTAPSDNATSTDNATSSATNTTMSQMITGGSNDTSMVGGNNMTAADNATGTTGATTTNMTSPGMNETTTAAEEDEIEPPYIVAGDWSLDVQDGSVSDFTANMTMVHTDGTGRHTHDVSNFQATDGSSIQLQQDGVTFIFGTSDVMTNGDSGWTGVDTLIVIENSNAVSITLSTDDDHFQGQPLYGVVDSLTDENGNQLIETTQTAQQGNATSSTGNATGTAGTNQTGAGGQGNESGGFLGEVGEGFQNLTGLGQ